MGPAFVQGLEQSRHINDGEMRLVGARDLDLENVVAEHGQAGVVLGRARADSHGGIGLFDDGGQILAVKVGQLPVEGPELVPQRVIGIVTGGDGDDDALGRTAPESDLGGIARAEALASRKGEAGQTLEEGALARRLAADNDDLGSLDVDADVAKPVLLLQIVAVAEVVQAAATGGLGAIVKLGLDNVLHGFELK